MTPFELETRLSVEIAKLPKDRSIEGAVIVVRHSDGTSALQLGEIDGGRMLLRTVINILCEKGMTPENVMEKVPRAIRAAMQKDENWWDKPLLKKATI